MTIARRPDVKKELARLKDFQRTSVDYVFDRLFGHNPTRKFLLADEVGLGKTMVARGVIAKVIDHLWDKKDRIDVAYICSNAEIARQNINRLNLSGQAKAELASRLTLLPTQVRDLQRNKLNFVSLTPGTSFNLRSSMGVARERRVLYWLLRRTWRVLMQGVVPIKILRGHTGFDRFNASLTEEDRRRIDPQLAQKFTKRLRARDRRAKEEGEPLYRYRFAALCERFARLPRNALAPWDVRQEQAALISDLRGLLAATCVQALDPDLIIMDEFQRFRDLLHAEDDAGKLARHLFEAEDARVLLLSATPYKMYTTSGEADDDHYADFLRTLRFLYGDGEKAATLERLLRDFRRGLFRLGDDGFDQLGDTRQQIETLMRRVMARTERLAVTADRDGMLTQVETAPAPLQADDITSYLHLQRLAGLLEQRDTLEYWKSSPYLLNFMEHYKLKRRFRRQLDDPHVGPALRKILTSANGTLLPWERMRRYEKVEPPNPQLKQMLDDCIDSGLWRLLWLAPSLPYYELDGVFADGRVQRMTKRLVFSSWHVVPRALSILLSYESERRMMALSGGELDMLDVYRTNRQLLNFTRSSGRLTGMPVLALLYPSITLAELGDPLAVRRERGMLGSDAVVASVADRLSAPLKQITAHAPQVGREDAAWYWAAPLLLDMHRHRAATEAWFTDNELAKQWAGPSAEEGWADHVTEARHVVEEEYELGRPPANLAHVMAKMAIAGPAVCGLRAITRVTGASASDHATRHAAGSIGWSFRSLFNLPTSISLLQGLDNREPYWERVLDYSVTGCLQSVLDEHAHILRESLGLHDADPSDAASQIAEQIAKAAGLHAATPGVDIVDPTRNGDTITNRRMRSRFAMRFGDERVDDRNEETEKYRGDDVRAAFNSPFRPFVLATTSIGQEGLDFHPYCHAVVHWNLPSNPVDLEQREGRVHRYKGHAVRRNVATRYVDDIGANGHADPWQELFDLACGEPDRPSDLRPFWVYPLEGGATIERHVPMLPMSREHGQLQALCRSLAVYRMVFGQPRQDDLLSYLLQRIPRDQLDTYLDDLRINLTPAPPRTPR